MPLYLYFSPSFKRSLNSLSPAHRKIVGRILESLEVYYAGGCNLSEAQKIAPRFFYKQLRKPYYEAGVESNVRVVIRRESERCIAMVTGNHDQIKRFLKNT